MGRDIDNGDGTVDHIQQDIDVLRVSGTRRGGEEMEDRKRAVMKMTGDNHQQDINDPRVLGTRLGGTKAMKMTADDHQQDINDPSETMNGTRTRTLPTAPVAFLAWSLARIVPCPVPCP